MTELRNSFREELERQPPSPHSNPEPKSRVLVRGGHMPGTIVAPGRSAPLIVRPPSDKAPDPRPLRVGDKVRALGYVYRVRKVTGKDVVMRPVRS